MRTELQKEKARAYYHANKARYRLNQETWRANGGKESQKRWRDANPEVVKRYSRKAQIKLMGINPNTIPPKTNCQICGSIKDIVLDHCHKNKIFRGWLCRCCNSGIGMFYDNPDLIKKAEDYLRCPSSTQMPAA